ncbi:MAG: hypothetical protein AB1714_08805 [Acidobacteriota bacterium]
MKRAVSAVQLLALTLAVSAWALPPEDGRATQLTNRSQPSGTAADQLFFGVGPSVRLSPLFGFRLLNNMASLWGTPGAGSERVRPVTLMKRDLRLLPVMNRLPGLSTQETPKDKPLDTDTKYRWLLRSQRRNVLRSERGYGFEGSTTIRMRPARAQRNNNMRTEISVGASSDVESTGESFGTDGQFTDVKVAFPVLESSETTVQGRVSGDSGYYTWAARANLALREIDDHAMDAGVVVGSLLFQSGATPGSHPDDQFDQQFMASAYARDRWDLHPRYAVSYGLTYQRSSYPTGSSFFNPDVTFAAALGAGVKLDNQFAYGVNLPGKLYLQSSTAIPEGYPLSQGVQLQPEKFVAYKARLEKQLTAGHSLDVCYVMERVEKPILQVPYKELEPIGGVPTYRFLLANSTDMRSHGVQVGYRAQLTPALASILEYRFGRSKALNPAGIASYEGDFAKYFARAGDEYVHTLAANLTFFVPSTRTSISGLYRWDSLLVLRPDYITDSLDDPTTEMDISVRQPIPFFTTGLSCWEILFDLRNPIAFDEESVLALGRERRPALLVPHPRRISGGLMLKF